MNFICLMATSENVWSNTCEILCLNPRTRDECKNIWLCMCDV